MKTGHAFKIGNEILRYAEGSQQFRRFAQFNLPPLEHFAPDLALRFLTETMTIDPDQIIGPRVRPDLGMAAPLTKFTETFCVLARQVLVDAGLPAFDTELIVGTPKTGDQHVTLTLPVIEFIPARVYLLAYRSAFDLVLRLSEPSMSLAKIRPMADALEKLVIDRIRWECGSGPNCIHLLKAAFARGVQISHTGRSVYQLGTGAHAVLVERSLTQGDAAIGARSAKDKWTTSKWLQQNGVPTAGSALATTPQEAQAAAGRLGYPVVVKPENQDGSQGVTVDVADDAHLETAFAKANEFTKFIMIEQRVPGHCHRLVTFRNRFVFAFTRHPKAVIGDGTQTIAQLVQTAQKERAKKVAYKAEKPFLLDASALECLTTQGLEPQSVPAEKEIVCLRRNNTLEDGGHNEIITERLHPENVRLVERISRLFRLESMGLDLISTDPTRPWYETGSCITEVNSMPQIGANSAKIYIETIFGETHGAVPVHCYIGDAAAMEKAKAHRAQLEKDGVMAMLTSHEQTIGAQGEQITYRPGGRLVERATALLSDTQTEALVMVIHDDEMLHRGRPMLHVSSVHRVNESLNSFRDRGKSLSIDRIDALIRVFEDGLAL